MRTDLTTNGLQQPQNTGTERAAKGTAGNQTGATAEASTAGDRANFSFDPARIGALTAQALAAPEIRQAKVASLAQAIRSGGYMVDATRVASAMAAEWSGGEPG
jgi:flagellar biosynthesis anti-sigma factor FlgM